MMNVSPPLKSSVDGPLLLREDLSHVAVLTVNRPQTRNLLSEAMLAALRESLAAIAADPKVYVVVLAAQGPVFSAGHDLREMSAHRADPDGGRGYFQALMERCSAVMQQIVALPQPVIAAIEGTATAAGCQLVAACDLAIAGADAKFGTSGINVGLFCSTPMVAVSRKVSRKHAMELLLTGDLIPAAEALRIGLINRTAPSGQAREAAIELAQQIATKSPAAIRHGKRAFYRQAEMSLADAYRLATQVMADNMMEAETQEGIAAFFEKRKPVWTEKP
jgi:enoyl-CoA hydratase/carnithine racemase